MSNISSKTLKNILSALHNNQNIILFGEIHGIKESYQILQETIDFFVKRSETIILLLEWPQNLATELNNFVFGRYPILKWQKWNFAKIPDGRISKEAILFLDWIRKKNILLSVRKKIRIDCLDFGENVFVQRKTWNSRDRFMGKNILQLSRKYKNSRIIGSIGNIHASKTIIRVRGKEYIPVASYLPTDKVVSINLQYVSGAFFNFGFQQIKKSSKPSILKSSRIQSYYQGYDYNLCIQRAHPITLMGKYNAKTKFIDFL